VAQSSWFRHLAKPRSYLHEISINTLNHSPSAKVWGGPKENYVMKSLALTIIGTSMLAASACTTVPKSNDGFLSRTDRLEAAKGMRGKRLATPPPSPPIERNSKLQIERVVSVGNVTAPQQITPAERALIENALARNACNDLSKHFDIIASDVVSTDAYKLRIGLINLEPTGKFGAAVGIATGFFSPVGGVRPPIGLGSLTVEFELLKPGGEQVAAMVWSRKADMVMADASASRIGDAYSFASDATSDFARLASRQATNSANARGIAIPFRDKPDEVCAIYGQETNNAARVVGFLGVPVPPEMVDKGPKP
jgi:hypothetical protein